MAHMRAFVAACCAVAAAAAAATSSPIKHVVFVQMENRAFDHMLGWMTKLNPAINGLTGKEFNPINPLSTNTTNVFVDNLAAYVDPDPGHGVADTAQQVFGRTWGDLTQETMNGFIANAVNNTGSLWAPSIMKCFDPANVPIITTLASEFALIDAFHSALPGPTYPNRLFTLSATSYGFGANNMAQTIEGFPQTSITHKLSEANVSTNLYISDAATAWLFKDMRSIDELSKVKLLSDFFKDAASGNLPQFASVEPAYFTIPGIQNATDQHPAHDVADGERFLKSVYEALRASPAWNSTVLIITYDEHGGFYDHVPPPTQGVPNPDGRACSDCGIPFNFDRLGVRVPAIVVSPWVKRGTLVHTAPDSVKPTPTSQMELSSIPATLHQVFNTDGFLTARDAWATPLNWIWEQSGVTTPRTDCPMTLPLAPGEMPSVAGKKDGKMPLSHLQVDLMHLMNSVFGFADSLEQSQQLLQQQSLDTEAEAGSFLLNNLRRKLAAVKAAKAATA